MALYTSFSKASAPPWHELEEEAHRAISENASAVRVPRTGKGRRFQVMVFMAACGLRYAMCPRITLETRDERDPA